MPVTEPESGSDRDSEKYDAILIGSGLGSLSTAGFLARAGQRVLILERHTIGGGFSHSFKRKGFEWDVGIHYVGQVHLPKSPMRRLTDFLSDGALAWESMGSVYDRIQVGAESYDFASGLEPQIASLLRKFPKEERAIRSYYTCVRKTARSSAWFFAAKSMPKWLAQSFGKWSCRYFRRMAERTTDSVIRGFTGSEELVAVLSGQCGDYGLTPKRSSFGIHAIIVDHYLEGASYPAGGARRLLETMRPAIERAGGKIQLSAEVEAILLEKGRAVGVRLKSGRSFYAPVIVSGIGVGATFERLIPKEVDLPKPVKAGLREVTPSLPHLCLYVGLRGSDAELELPQYNIWKYSGTDFDSRFSEWRTKSRNDAASESPLYYISFPSAKDPKWSSTHPGKSTVQVITPFRYEWVEEWEETRWRRRGESYEAMKAKWSEALLEALFSVAPQLRGKVEHAELSTPLSTRHFTGNERGQIYGLEHSPARYRQKWLRARTFIPGLYLTGQDLVTVGVGGALFSGVITTLAISKRVFIRALLRAKQQ